MSSTNRLGDALARFSQRVTDLVGSSFAFASALAVIAAWVVTGPLFRYSDTWQLVINTGTTIVTFLMVFLIQRSQNKESLAMQLKLNEIVAAIEGASNRLVDVESVTEAELRVLREHYRVLAKEALKDGDLTKSHSVDEAQRRHARKAKRRRMASDELDGVAQPSPADSE